MLRLLKIGITPENPFNYYYGRAFCPKAIASTSGLQVCFEDNNCTNGMSLYQNLFMTFFLTYQQLVAVAIQPIIEVCFVVLISFQNCIFVIKKVGGILNRISVVQLKCIFSINNWFLNWIR